MPDYLLVLFKFICIICIVLHMTFIKQFYISIHKLNNILFHNTLEFFINFSFVDCHAIYFTFIRNKKKNLIFLIKY